MDFGAYCRALCRDYDEAPCFHPQPGVSVVDAGITANLVHLWHDMLQHLALIISGQASIRGAMSGGMSWSSWKSKCWKETLILKAFQSSAVSVEIAENEGHEHIGPWKGAPDFETRMGHFRDQYLAARVSTIKCFGPSHRGRWLVA